MNQKGISLSFKKENCPFVPERPGVYIFRDARGSILYIGKAVNLRKRIQSYFRADERNQKTLHICSRSATMEFMVCSSEKEALILEDTLIKRERPLYNIRLRDDKAYPFIRIALQHPYPRIHLVRRRRNDKALYFGPYTSADAARKTIRFVARTFGLRTCTDSTFKKVKRPCLRAQIGMCCAPCLRGGIHLDYSRRVEDAASFLGGRRADLLERLRDQMRAASRALDFERASVLRDQILAIEKVIEPQDICLSHLVDLDCLGVAMDHALGIAVLVLMKVRKGRVSGQELFELENTEGEEVQDVITAFLKEYSASWAREILLPVDLEDRVVVEDFLKETTGEKAIKLRTPKKGEKRRLIELSRKNAIAALDLRVEELDRWKGVSHALKGLLGLEFTPEWIECIDISHTSGQSRVGSLVCFKEGRPSKDDYRHYGLDPRSGADDYAGIMEVVKRRLERAKREGRGPDLLVIDGGKGQLNSALETIINEKNKYKGRPPFLVSIAKGRDQEGDRLYLQGRVEPLYPDRSHPGFLFLQRVRDEAHRFGLSTHRRVRARHITSSILDDIPGIGPKKKASLLKAFGSIDAIRNASLEEIEKVHGITHSLAILIKQALAYYKA